MKHAGGRPTKYDPIMAETSTLGAYLTTTGRDQTQLPTVEGFALHLGVDHDTAVEWVNKYPEFSVTIKALKAIQRMQLMDDGLYGGKEVNSTMAIFLLKANHGMVETSHTDITTNGKDLAPNIMIDTKPTKGGE